MERSVYLGKKREGEGGGERERERESQSNFHLRKYYLFEYYICGQ
jgi:hypothetical protein